MIKHKETKSKRYKTPSARDLAKITDPLPSFVPTYFKTKADRFILFKLRIIYSRFSDSEFSRWIGINTQTWRRLFVKHKLEYIKVLNENPNVAKLMGEHYEFETNIQTNRLLLKTVDELYRQGEAGNYNLKETAELIKSLTVMQEKRKNYASNEKMMDSIRKKMNE